MMAALPDASKQQYSPVPATNNTEHVVLQKHIRDSTVVNSQAKMRHLPWLGASELIKTILHRVLNPANKIFSPLNRFL